MKDIISALQEQEAKQEKCPHKKTKLFEYVNREYPAGGYRCIGCGYPTILFKTKKEFLKEVKKIS